MPPEKPELSDGLMIKARQAFANEAPWMGIVFEIMAHIGCRFAESSIPKERIDFEKKILWVEDSKRKSNDPKKLFAVPMTGQLKNILLPLRSHSAAADRRNESAVQCCTQASGRDDLSFVAGVFYFAVSPCRFD